MKHLTMAVLMAITLCSCKKTPDRVVTEHPTPEQIPCNVSFYTLVPYGNMTLTINGSQYVTGEISSVPSCEQGFTYHSYVGRSLTYAYKTDTKVNTATITLVDGCNYVELK